MRDVKNAHLITPVSNHLCHMFKSKLKEEVMNVKVILAAAATLALSNVAYASEYVCKVYCNSGSTNVVIAASSASDAARKIDPQAVADRVCKDAGKGNASTKTMGSAQCDRK